MTILSVEKHVLKSVKGAREVLYRKNVSHADLDCFSFVEVYFLLKQNDVGAYQTQRAESGFCDNFNSLVDLWNTTYDWIYNCRQNLGIH